MEPLPHSADSHLIVGAAVEHGSRTPLAPSVESTPSRMDGLGAVSGQSGLRRMVSHAPLARNVSDNQRLQSPARSVVVASVRVPSARNCRNQAVSPIGVWLWICTDPNFPCVDRFEDSARHHGVLITPCPPLEQCDRATKTHCWHGGSRPHDQRSPCTRCTGTPTPTSTGVRIEARLDKGVTEAEDRWTPLTQMRG